MNSYVIYKGIPTCEVQKQLELQQWILDQSSRPYVTAAPPEQNQKLITRSASTAAKEDKKFTVDKQLELQRMILG